MIFKVVNFMHLVALTSCTLATLLICNLCESAAASPGLEFLNQPNLETLEDISISRDPLLKPEQSTLPNQSTISNNVGNFVVPTIVEPAQLNQSSETPSVEQKQPDTPDSSINEIDDSDDGLGEIEIVRRPIPRRQPDIQLQLRSSGLFNLGNTGFISSGTLLATPKLGPATRLNAFIGGGVFLAQQFRFSDFTFLNFGVGVRHRLATNTYAQLGFVQGRLYETASSRDLVDNAVVFSVNREDRLAEKLRLNTSYELRASFTDQSMFVIDQSRVANSLEVGLSYDITPQLEGALGYKLLINSFTGVDLLGQDLGTKVQQRVGGVLTYRFNPQMFMSGSMFYSFGEAIDPFTGEVNLNDLVFSVSFGLNLF
jgi:hypothetical protein